MMHRVFRWTIAGLIGLLAGCGQATITIRAVEPGLKEVTGIERLAVLDMLYTEDAEAGRDIANVIVAEINQTGAFEVMERSAVKRVLEEQKFGTSGVVDTATVTSIGKLLGVDGVVVGEVAAYGSEGRVLGRAASIAVNTRLVSVQSGKVIFSDSITINTKKAGNETREAMLTRIAHEVAREFVAKIAPHYVEREKYMLSTGGDAGQANKRGITFARNKLWDKAQLQFEMAMQVDPQNAAIQNNLGVCHERAGRLHEAFEAYERAIALDPDDEAIQKNLASLRSTTRAPELSAKELLERQKNLLNGQSSKPTTQSP